MSSKNSYGSRIRQKGHEVAVDLNDLRAIVKEAVEAKIEAIKVGAGDALVSVRDGARSMARNTHRRATEIVTRSPWKSLAAAAAIGALAAWLLRRR